MVNLTDAQQELFQQARENDLNSFSEHFFKLPYSGTVYTPEDRPETYSVLYDEWVRQGKPSDEFDLLIRGEATPYLVAWGGYGSYPMIVFPHGYIFLPWGLKMLTRGRAVTVAEGGTGSAKTSTIAIAALTKCAIYAGFDFLNVGPSYLSAADLMEETAKWIADGPYEAFVVRTKSGELWRQKPYPRMVIDTGLGSYSTITCLTLGVQAKLGNVVLGKGYDWINVDEASLVDDVGEAIPKLITRYRGTRRTGLPRLSVPAFSLITNPHHGNMGFEDLKAKAIAETELEHGTYYFVRPSVEENIYITQQQLRTQRSILSEAEQERWLKGLDDQFKTQGTIPLVLIDNCREPYLDDLVDQSCGDGFYESRREMGVVHYELPPEKTSEYLAWGDPGTANLISMRVNNVPTVGVFDITDFPMGPAVLVALHCLDGGGRYAPWIGSIKHMMIKYSVAVAAYDATGMGRAFSEWPDMQHFPLYPVSLGGNNKGTARTMFMLFCDKGLFAWPKLKMLWHQANLYRESGPRLHKIPDDLIAGLFVASFYLRFRFWGELSKMFKWNEKLREPEIPALAAPTRSRYQRRKSRYG